MSSTETKPRRAGRLASGDAIREAAASIFLEKGYDGTSMDEIAAAARISKQTIYTHFPGKRELFTELVLGNTEPVERFVAEIERLMSEASDLESGLRAVARAYLGVVGRPEVLRLRRLVIGEAGRFPELARTYYERVPGRVLETLAMVFARLGETGRLRLDDPILAAQHFAWLTIGMPIDRGMFFDEMPAGFDAGRTAAAAVRVFMSAYGE